MLTIAQTLMGNPNLILLDEPSEELAPLIVETIRELVLQVKQENVTILLAEQNIYFALDLSERVYMIDDGRVPHHTTVEGIRNSREIIEKYLGVHVLPPTRHQNTCCLGVLPPLYSLKIYKSASVLNQSLLNYTSHTQRATLVKGTADDTTTVYTGR
jgi:ABC-type multidrug transport system ATPase subunit